MAISSNCWKYLVLTFNVLFAMSAVVLFAASGYLLYKLFIFRHFIGVNVEYPAILLLMMAIITCSVAWIGWRTAKSMHQIHVIVTGVLIILVVVIEFSCFVWAMVVWDNIEIDVKTTMTGYFAQSTQPPVEPNSVDSIRWDRLHVKFQCCGVGGPNDYATTGHVPFSCCGQGPLDDVHKPYAADCSAVFQRGCAKPLHDYARNQLLLVAMTALTASILQQICRSLSGYWTSRALSKVTACAVGAFFEVMVLALVVASRWCDRSRRSGVYRLQLMRQSTGIFCTFFLAQAIKEKRRSSMRTSTSIRESTFAAADDTLLASSATAPTLPKY